MLVAPSMVEVGQPFDLHVVVLDGRRATDVWRQAGEEVRFSASASSQGRHPVADRSVRSAADTGTVEHRTSTSVILPPPYRMAAADKGRHTFAAGAVISRPGTYLLEVRWGDGSLPTQSVPVRALARLPNRRNAIAPLYRG